VPIEIAGMLAAGIAFHNLLLFIFLDWSFVWKNHTYLEMSSILSLKYVNFISASLISTYKFVGLISVFLVAFLWRRSTRFISLFIIPFAIFSFLFQLGAHSRFAVLYIVVFAGVRYIIFNDRNISIFLFTSTLPILAFCLGGRGTDVHGISAILHAREAFASYFDGGAGQLFLNALEGSFVTSELFKRSFNASLPYRILSFSPLMSFIDNFDTLISHNMYKVGPFSPPSAYFELRSFGWPFAVFYVLVVILTGRLSANLFVQSPTLTHLLSNTLVLLATYLSMTYPVRHVFRYYVIALVICAFSIWQSARVRKRERMRGRLGYYDRKVAPGRLTK
jgi:hypothetical protein